VEGESSDEAEKDSRGPLPDQEFDDPEDNGSVEDIEFVADDQALGETDESGEDAASDDDNSMDDESGSEPGRGSMHSRSNRVNGFVDAEAEEWSGSENESDEYAE